MEAVEPRRVFLLAERDFLLSFLQSHNIVHSPFVTLGVAEGDLLLPDLPRREGGGPQRLQVRVELGYDGERRPCQVRRHVPDSDVIWEPHPVAHPLQRASARVGGHPFGQRSAQAEAGPAGGEPEGHALLTASSSLPVWDLQRLRGGGLAQVPLAAVVEAPQLGDERGDVDVVVVVEVAEPPANRKGKGRKLGEHSNGISIWIFEMGKGS